MLTHHHNWRVYFPRDHSADKCLFGFASAQERKPSEKMFTCRTTERANGSVFIGYHLDLGGLTLHTPSPASSRATGTTHQSADTHRDRPGMLAVELIPLGERDPLCVETSPRIPHRIIFMSDCHIGDALISFFFSVPLILRRLRGGILKGPFESAGAGSLAICSAPPPPRPVLQSH